MAQRYISQGIADDIESGANVAVVVAPYDTVHGLISQVMEYTDENYARVFSGDGRISHESGGDVRFVHSYHELRGTRLDVLLIPSDMPPAFREFVPFVAEVMRY